MLGCTGSYENKYKLMDMHTGEPVRQQHAVENKTCTRQGAPQETRQVLDSRISSGLKYLALAVSTAMTMKPVNARTFPER